MLKTFAFVVLLFFPSVVCNDEWICQYIKRDGRYDGLGIYHRMIKDKKDNSYVMFNRFGNEWRFEVTNPPEIGIQLIDNSVKPFFAPNIVNRFSIFKWTKSSVPSVSSVKTYSCECNLTSIPESTYINIDCIKREGFSFNPIPTHFKRKDVRNRVILKAEPHLITTDDREKYIMMLKKGGHPKDYDPIAVNPCENQIKNCTKGYESKHCKPVPKFVEQMYPKLFNSIEGVVDFENGKESNFSGHLLLLNINGRPKTCVTFEKQNISAECNSAEKMRSLFKECFKDDPTSSPTPTSTPKIETKSTKIWLIVAIILIIIAVILAIVCFCCQKRKRNPNYFNDAFNTVLHRDPKTLSTRKDESRTGSSFLIVSNESTHTELAKTSKSQPKGTQFKTGVKTTKNPPKTSAKPSQSPKT